MADLAQRTKTLNAFTSQVRQAFNHYKSIINIHAYNPQKSGDLANCGFVMIGDLFGFEVFIKHGMMELAPFSWPSRSPKSYGDVMAGGVPKKWWTVSHLDCPVNVIAYIKKNFRISTDVTDIELPDPAHLLEKCLRGNALHLKLLKHLCMSGVFQYEDFVKLAVSDTTKAMKWNRKHVW